MCFIFYYGCGELDVEPEPESVFDAGVALLLDEEPEPESGGVIGSDELLELEPVELEVPPEFDPVF